jgi:dsDNA-specific endonuclease/ATPase MutS2
MEPVRIPVEDVLDLHTFHPRDVKAAVEEYLNEAHRLGFPALRIIHGRGIGVQREIVRSVLARTPFVTAFRDAPAEAGGRGATVVDLLHVGNKRANSPCSDQPSAIRGLHEDPEG